jgi:PhnB protein
MSIQSLNPYVRLNGNAEKAIRHYETALGAMTEDLMRWGEMPGMKVAPEHAKRVMHSRLRIGAGELMVADGKPGDDVEIGGNVEVCLHFDEVGDMTRKFEALAADGKVTMPLDDTFWSARFGTLTDAFGVRWMFNCQTKKA